MWFDLSITFIVFRERSKASRWPAARAVEQFPVGKDECATGQIAYENFVANLRATGEVVANLDLKPIAPELPQLDERKQG
jgi:hypothetical protein